MTKDFGTRLREARERKGISLRQVAASTKISVGALEGLERNDISKLPGGIFSRAFVRSYAIEVGLDPDETVRHFLQQFGGEPGPGGPEGTAPPLPSSHAGRAAPAQPEEIDFESRQRMASVVLKLALLSAPVVAAILYFSSRSAAPSAESTAAPAPAGSAPAAVERAPEVPAGAPGQESQRPEAARAPAAASPAEANAAPVTIDIAPTAECWAQLTADGQVVVARIIAAGEHEAHLFRTSAVLQVGDAAACAFSINGRAARPLGGPRQVREIRITPDNYTSFLP